MNSLFAWPCITLSLVIISGAYFQSKGLDDKLKEKDAIIKLLKAKKPLIVYKMKEVPTVKEVESREQMVITAVLKKELAKTRKALEMSQSEILSIRTHTDYLSVRKQGGTARRLSQLKMARRNIDQIEKTLKSDKVKWQSTLRNVVQLKKLLYGGAFE